MRGIKKNIKRTSQYIV